MVRWNPGYCKYGHAMDDSNTYTSPSGIKACRACQRVRHRSWQHTEVGIQKSRLKAQKSHSKRYFGGKSEAVYERDGHKCVSCGMTMEEHLEKFNCRLSIDHIDNNGCNKPLEKKNNKLSNLQTLCLPCHGRKDSPGARRKLLNTNE